MVEIASLNELESLSDLRQSIREWLEKNVPKNWQTEMSDAPEERLVAFQKDWFRKLKDAGYVAPHWPIRWGGAGFSFAEQIVLYDEMARARAPRLTVFFISLYHTPATLLEWGSDAQKNKHLPAILEGEIWCQGFSEPDAGSDLAGLRTKAERKGDKYIVNGQKIWSSGAHHARYCLLLARTAPELPKHKGISFFILDLTSPGVECRKIKQITGEAHFNEIFLDNVEIPFENLIGEENAGWSIAQSTLSSERGLAILELTERMRSGFKKLVDDAKTEGPKGGRPIDDDEYRRRLADIHVRIETLRILVNNMLSRLLKSTGIGIEPSIIKVYYSEVLRDLSALGVDIGGMESQIVSPYVRIGGDVTGNWMIDYFNSWSWTIAGGSNEIQRNIISERGLGLPKEPR